MSVLLINRRKATEVVDNTFTTLALDATNIHNMGFAQVGGLYAPNSDYTRYGTHARVILNTSLTTFEVECYNSSSDSNFGIGLLACNIAVNGVFHSQYSLDNYRTWQYVTVTGLPAGAKEVLIMLEPAIKFYAPGGIPISGGPTFRNIRYSNAGTTTVVPVAPVANRLVIYGDSIATGANAFPVSTKAYSRLLEDLMPDWAIGNNSISGRSLAEDIADQDLLVDHLVSALDGTVNNWLYIEIGFNDDYGGVSAATFKTRLKALVNSVLELKSDTVVWLQSLLKTGFEGNGSSQEYPATYRTAVQDAVTELGGNVYYVDGDTLIDGLWDLTDGIHPNNDGHGKISDRIFENYFSDLL